MAGIYIHIPFCKQACHYCNFYFTLSLTKRSEFISALQKEIALTSDFLQQDTIDTLYFGGGTPSLLNAAEWQAILSTLRTHYQLNGLKEFTIEANPDDLYAEKLKLFQDLRQDGLNRFSIGVQSFADEDLKYMHRAHNAAEALSSVMRVREAGFTNYSVDLIYGTPTMSDKQWHKNLQQCFRLQVPHISCYALTVEPKTALERNIRNLKVQPVIEESTARHFEILLEEMQKHGYVQYEISNFCLPGFEAVHNSNYWQYKKYLGLGPSAHSFDGSCRRWNVANLGNYLSALQDDKLKFEEEHLSIAQQYNEYIYMSLRTSQGCSFNFVEQRIGGIWLKHLRENLLEVSDDLIAKTVDGVRLTNAGKLLADHIVLQLMADC